MPLRYRRLPLAQNGNGAFDTVKRGRAAKVAFMLADPVGFMAILADEIRKAGKRAAKRGDKVAFRLNAFSDIPFERYLPADVFTVGEFYDYTKWPIRLRPSMPNYKLVRSVTERHTVADVADMLAANEVPVVVFDAPRYSLPSEWHGMPVVDGDVTDERFNDSGVIVGLSIKGRKRAARESGFARSV